MIKAGGRDRDGVPMLILGFSRENLLRLLTDQPVSLTPQDMESINCPPMRVIVTAAETEQVIERQLKMLNPNIREVDPPINGAAP